MQYFNTKLSKISRIKRVKKIKFDEFDIFHQNFYQQCAMEPRSC